MSSKLPLISSLFGQSDAPEPIVEKFAPPEPAGERIEIIDADATDKHRDAGLHGDRDAVEIPYFLDIVYYKDGEEIRVGMVNATLFASHGPEDDSFDHAFGTYVNKYHSFTDLAWKNPQIPHSSENYELFQLDPERVKYISDFIKKALVDMDEDDIKKHVDAEEWADKLAPEPDFNEPDDY